MTGNFHVFRCIILGVFLSLMGLAACSPAQPYIKRANKLLVEGKAREALREYKRALELDDDNSEAESGVRAAKRQVIRIELARSKEALRVGRVVDALRGAIRASKYPLGLKEVSLRTKVNRAIDAADLKAREAMDKFLEEKHYLVADDLAQLLLDVDPRDQIRQKYVKDISKQGIKYYLAQAKQLNRAKRPAAATLRYAMAKYLGADVDESEIANLWSRARAQHCFRKPQIRWKLKKGVEAPTQKIQTQIAEKLGQLSDRCLGRERKVEVNLKLSKYVAEDEENSRAAYKAYPGVQIETEETYYEEVKTVEIQEFSEYELQVKQEERRDCAPRPGQPRGCRTWLEEVQTKVPVKVKKPVEKIEKVAKKRPVKEIPADKALKYSQRFVRRAVEVEGKIAFGGELRGEEVLKLFEESSDASNPRVEGGGVVVFEDPMEAVPLSKLIAKTASQISTTVAKRAGRSIKKWAGAQVRDARRQIVEGNLDSGEEIYLGLLLIGLSADDSMTTYFQKRHGEEVGRLVELVGRYERAAFEEKEVKKTTKQSKPQKQEIRREETISEVPAEPSAEEKTAEETPPAETPSADLAEFEEDMKEEENAE